MTDIITITIKYPNDKDQIIKISKDNYYDLLTICLKHKASLKYGCRKGVCGQCKCKVSGDISIRLGDAIALTASEYKDGWVLLCQSYANSDVMIEVVD